MTELPRSLPEFEARFPDDAACARWLMEKRWPAGAATVAGTEFRRDGLSL
jgi:hypothetical protein